MVHPIEQINLKGKSHYLNTKYKSFQILTVYIEQIKQIIGIHKLAFQQV